MIFHLGIEDEVDLKEQYRNGKVSLEDVLNQISDISSRPYQEEKKMLSLHPTIRFNVKEDMDRYSGNGIHPADTIGEALDIWCRIPIGDTYRVKGIEFDIQCGSVWDGSYPLMASGVVLEDSLNSFPFIRKEPLIQNAISDCKALMQARGIHPLVKVAGTEYMNPDQVPILTEILAIGNPLYAVWFQDQMYDMRHAYLNADTINNLKLQTFRSMVPHTSSTEQEWGQILTGIHQGLDSKLFIGTNLSVEQIKEIQKAQIAEDMGFVPAGTAELISQNRGTPKQMRSALKKEALKKQRMDRREFKAAFRGYKPEHRKTTERIDREQAL